MQCDYRKFELCEALGEDGNWYGATIERQNADDTYCVCLRDYPAARWRAVGAHNLRKHSFHFVKKFLEPRPIRTSTRGESYYPSQPLEKEESLCVATEDTFPEFEEPRRISIPKLEHGGAEFEEKYSAKRRVTIQAEETLSEFGEQARPRVSFVNGDESFEENLPASLPTIEDEVHQFAIQTMSPTVPMCLNPFSFLIFAQKTNPVRKRNSRKRKRKQARKKSLQDSMKDGIRRSSHLFHGSGEGWTLEELMQYKAEIEAELNRLRNKSLGAMPSDQETLAIRRGTTHQYVSITSSKLRTSSMDREGSETLIFQRKVDETMELDFERRVWLSNQWDLDKVTLQAQFLSGDLVEVFHCEKWLLAVVHSCFVKNNIAYLFLQSDPYVHPNDNQYPVQKHTVLRFGNNIRPRGYIEAEVLE